MMNYHDCNKLPMDVEIERDGTRWYLSIDGDDGICCPKPVNFCPFCGMALLKIWIKPELIKKEKRKNERIDTKGGFLKKFKDYSWVEFSIGDTDYVIPILQNKETNVKAIDCKMDLARTGMA